MVRPSLALVLLASLGACGGKTNEPTATPDTGVVPDGSTDGSPDAVPDATADATPDAPTDVLIDGPSETPPPETTCDALAAAVCTKSTETCCTSHGSTYDSARCVDAEKGYCLTQRDWVTLGRLTYDASQLEACKAAWTKGTTLCKVDWVAWAKLFSPCTQMFNGVKTPGTSCTYDIECHSPPNGGGYCDTTTKKCRSYDFVGLGAGCNFTGKEVHYCDAGLYCDTTSTTPKCTKERALGEACDGADDLSCGYGKVCKDLKCAAGLPPGSACTGTGIECASWTCTSGTCASNDVLLSEPSAGLCSGVATDAGTSG